MQQPEDRRFIFIFHSLLVAILAAVVAAFIYIPTVVGIIYVSTLGLFLLLALLAGMLTIGKWAWDELSLLARLDQAGPKGIWRKRSEKMGEASKIALAWAIAVAATTQIDYWAVEFFDRLMPRYNVLGSRIRPEEGVTWSTIVVFVLVLITMRLTGTTLFMKDNSTTER